MVAMPYHTGVELKLKRLYGKVFGVNPVLLWDQSDRESSPFKPGRRLFSTYLVRHSPMTLERINEPEFHAFYPKDGG
jgi:hypothetical protein